MVRGKSFYTTSSCQRQDEANSAELASDQESLDSLEDYAFAQASDTPIYEEFRAQPRHELQRRIHILGVGNVGLFVAHSLAGIPNRPPITLLAHHFGAFRSWTEAGERIEVVTDGVVEGRRGFDLEYMPPLSPDSFQAASKQPGDTDTQQGPLAEDDNPEPPISEVTDEYPPQESSAEDDIAEPPTSEGTDEYQRQVPLAQDDDPEPPILEFNDEYRPPEPPERRLRPAEQYLQNIQNEVYEVGYHARESPTEEDDHIIWNLIVSTKASATVAAVSKVAHRLRRDSSIMFLQNGIGMLDELSEQLFPNVETRPNYVVGVISHGLNRSKPYQINHAGFGTIAVGILPRNPGEVPFQYADTSRYLVRTITRTPIFAAVPFSPTDIFEQQLDKLAVNCIINPLTSVFDCTNGELMNSFSVTRIMRLLLAEISLVIRSLPELQGVLNKDLRYDPGRLEAKVVVVARRTAANISSMLHDVRERQVTEIDYINGYIIRRGEEMGIKCVLNYMLLHMVKAKGKVVGNAQDDQLPLELKETLLTHSEIPKRSRAPQD